MDFTPCSIPGAYVIAPQPHQDDRGRFMRAWCITEFADAGIDFLPVQANMSFSRYRGTVRGMHYQVEPGLEAKLMRCTRGAVFDVVADVRRASRTYGQWFGIELSAENGAMLYVPEGCAHGYQVLRDDTETYYLTSAHFAPAAVRGVRYDDPTLDIRWPLPISRVSEQDRGWPTLST
jgi:dTDP-4-dehydrorhamnose 3,5-epimerase